MGLFVYDTNRSSVQRIRKQLQGLFKRKQKQKRACCLLQSLVSVQLQYCLMMQFFIIFVQVCIITILLLTSVSFPIGCGLLLVARIIAKAVLSKGDVIICCKFLKVSLVFWCCLTIDLSYFRYVSYFCISCYCVLFYKMVDVGHHRQVGNSCKYWSSDRRGSFLLQILVSFWSRQILFLLLSITSGLQIAASGAIRQ